MRRIIVLLASVPAALVFIGVGSGSAPATTTTVAPLPNTATTVAKLPTMHRRHPLKGCNTAACDQRVWYAYLRKLRHQRYLRRIAERKRAVALPLVNASMFSPPDAGGALACGPRRDGGGSHGELLGWQTLGVANKTKRCGSMVTVCATRCATVPVIDRGPYVAVRVYDLSVATARAIGFTAGVGEIRATPG